MHYILVMFYQGDFDPYQYRDQQLRGFDHKAVLCYVTLCCCRSNMLQSGSQISFFFSFLKMLYDC